MGSILGYSATDGRTYFRDLRGSVVLSAMSPDTVMLSAADPATLAVTPPATVPGLANNMPDVTLGAFTGIIHTTVYYFYHTSIPIYDIAKLNIVQYQ